MDPEINEILKEISSTMDNVTWVERLEHSHQKVDPSCKIYAGFRLGWRFLVVGFVVAGKRMYDGTATHMTQGLIVHLTPELSEKAFKLATA